LDESHGKARRCSAARLVRRHRDRRFAAGEIVLACAIALASSASVAANGAAAKILTCKDAGGNTLITDPADPRCYKPPLNEAERAAADERKRKELEAYNACKAEQRSLQSLLNRYPNKEKHDAARQAALGQVETALRLSERRLEQLQVDRKHLLDEAEFYPNGNLPAKLRRDIDANSAVIAAQTQAIATQKDEAAQKNAFYDDELAKLKRLWLPQRGENRACVAPRD
jgi:hypothetical protein